MCLIAVAAAAEWALLIGQWPLFPPPAGWMWPRIEKPFGARTLLVIPMAAALAGVCFIIWRWPRPAWRNLLLLILAGWGMQTGFALLEGRGLDGLRNRMVYSGHSQFAEQAIAYDKPLVVITVYETFVRDQPNREFLRTKPPGQFLFYELNGRAANLFAAPSADPSARLQNLRTWAAIVWPLLCYLALMPLYYISARLLPRELAWHPCLLYLCAPNVLLVTLHLDQVLYPLLACGALALAVAAVRRGSLALAALLGAWLYLSWFVSFSLIPLAGLVAVLLVVYPVSASALGEPKPNWQMRLRLAGMLLAGILAAYALLYLAIFYNPVTRYRDAMAFHAGWKKIQPGLGFMIHAGWVNFIEFSVWLGFPMMALFMASGVMAAWKLCRSRASAMPIDWLILALMAMLVVMAFATKTLGEVMRLWIYCVPVICMAVALALARLAGSRHNWVFAALMTAQFITALVIKRFQDFW